MKHFILAAAFLSLSPLSFASECPQLAGKYLCPANEEDPSYLLVIRQKSSNDSTIEYYIEDDEDKEYFLTDNKSRKSKIKDQRDGKEYPLFTKAKCKNRELILESTMVAIKNGEIDAVQTTFNYYLDQNKNIYIEAAYSSKGEGYEETEICIRQ